MLAKRVFVALAILSAIVVVGGLLYPPLRGAVRTPRPTGNRGTTAAAEPPAAPQPPARADAEPPAAVSAPAPPPPPPQEDWQRAGAPSKAAYEYAQALLAEFKTWDGDPYQAGALRTIRQHMEDAKATPEDYRKLVEATGEPADDRPQRDWLIAVTKRYRFPGTLEEWRSPECRAMLDNRGGRTFLGRYGLAVEAVLDAYLGVEGVNNGKPMGLLGACKHINSLMAKAGWR